MYVHCTETHLSEKKYDNRICTQRVELGVELVVRSDAKAKLTNRATECDHWPSMPLLSNKSFPVELHMRH